MKELLRKVLWTFHLDLTRNLKYDRLTWRTMKKILHKDSNCVDVGCHKGEILDWMLELSPNGTHYGFEPIPEFFESLKSKYANRAIISQTALSNEVGTASFNYVKNAPAYSGFEKRSYAIDEPDIERIEVKKNTIDSELPPDLKVSLIKIDVEGAEFQVLEGAIRTIINSKPHILFEFGLGAADHYGTKPNDLFDLLQRSDMHIYTLKSFLSDSAPLSKSNFNSLYESNAEYYFIAAPADK